MILFSVLTVHKFIALPDIVCYRKPAVKKITEKQKI